MKKIKVLIGVTFLLSMGIFGYFIYDSILNLMADEVVVEATLLNKDKEIESLNDLSGDSYSKRIDTNYYVTFETNEKERLSFQVKPKTYNRLLIGDKGILKYQRNKYNSFELDN